MSDRGSTGDGWDEQPTEYVPPPRRDEPAEGSDLPPIGADRDPEPTRVVPTPPPAAEPTVAMPSTGDPIGPGGPYVPPGGGGPGGPGGPGDEPPFDEEAEQPWYRQPGPVAALIAGVAALVLGLIALLVIRSNDDNTLPTVVSTTTTPSTVPATSSSTTSTTTPGTTTSSSSTTSTTSPSTTTAPPTTTTTTTTTTPSTTTTTNPPATTTTSPATTTTVPGPTAWDVIQDNSDLSEFADAIRNNNLIDFVDGLQPVTVLAPNNASIGPDPLTPDQVRDQFVDESLTEAQLAQRRTVTTRNDNELAVELDPLRIGGVSIVVPDEQAANGYVQIVDGLVAPS